MSNEAIVDLMADKTSLPYKAVVLILQNALNQLKIHHASGKVYGALIPSNVYVYPEDNYRVELREAIDPILLPDDLSGLSLDDFLGLSPEHFNQNQGLDHRSDLYGLGYIAYYLLTGQANPYGAKTAVDLADKIMQGSLPDPSLVRPGIPEWLSRVVQKLTAPEKAQRYQSVFSLVRQIEAGLASEPNISAAPAITEPIAAEHETQKMQSANPRSDFNTYQPASRERPQKLSQGTFIKGLLAGIGFVIVVGAALFFILRGRDHNDQNSIASSDTNNFSTPDLVLVEGGEFMMGSEESKENDVKPVHTVRLSSFYMAKTELTQKEWTALMGSNPSDTMGDDLPVNQVSWFQAIAYCNQRSASEGLEPCYSVEGNQNPDSWSQGEVKCNWQASGYRLPTEAEWEFAAKGGIKDVPSRFSGSDTDYLVAWYNSNSNKSMQQVKKLAPNELGVYDMSGNVWEWCWDWYYPYESGQQSDPKGPMIGTNRTLRGGSFIFNSGLCQVFFRSFRPPANKFKNIGIRICRSLPGDKDY